MDKAQDAPEDDMLPEYDFTDAEIGRYAERYAERQRREERPRVRDDEATPDEHSSG